MLADVATIFCVVVGGSFLLVIALLHYDTEHAPDPDTDPTFVTVQESPMSVSLYLRHDRTALLVAADCLQENSFEEQASYLREVASNAYTLSSAYLDFRCAHIALEAGLEGLYSLSGRETRASSLVPTLEKGVAKLIAVSDQHKEDGHWHEFLDQVNRLLLHCRKFPNALVEVQA